jgi:hypothetical protein
MGRHIDQARAAGIDAFLVAWYGPGGDNQTEPNLSALLEEAAARNFKIGILFETNSPFLGSAGSVTAALQHALSAHAGQPAYLRVDGRPVIFFWRPSMYGVDAWRTIRNQVDPGFGSIWISEGVNTAYLAVFDGHHLYTNTWNPPSDLNTTNQKFARLVADARQQYGAYKFWVATVMPGYNDVRIRGGGGFSKDREGGAYYERGWQAAIGSQPNWIVVNSFNEWPEGSYIEPSQSYGDQFIGLTAAWSGQFKSGGGVNVQAANLPMAPPAPPTPTPLPEPAAPTAYVQVSLANLRGGSSTEHDIVGSAVQGAALPISGRSAAAPDWWQVRNGENIAWIYAPLVRAAGPLDQVALVELPLPAPEQPVGVLTPTPESPPATNNPILSRQP